MSDPIVDVNNTLSVDAARVAAWLSTRSKGAVTGGSDPIGFLLAHYRFRQHELSNSRIEQRALLRTLGQIEGLCFKKRDIGMKVNDVAALGRELVVLLDTIAQLVHVALHPKIETLGSATVTFSMQQLASEATPVIPPPAELSATAGVASLLT
jgi:hypothetical protein